MGRRLTTEGFIGKAIIIHGDRYDYSETEYKDARSKVKIICLEHGEFMQLPHNHLKGNGCFSCGHELRGVDKRMSELEFIKKSKKVHGNRYDYSNLKYQKASDKVNIICPKHGSFAQRGTAHLSGAGCLPCWGMEAI